MTGTSHHVVPSPQGGWSVKKGGSTRALKHFETREAAIEWGRELSRNQASVFVLHKRDGTVERMEQKYVNGTNRNSSRNPKSPV